jgi:hypothetical protein
MIRAWRPWQDAALLKHGNKQRGVSGFLAVTNKVGPGHALLLQAEQEGPTLIVI